MTYIENVNVFVTRHKMNHVHVRVSARMSACISQFFFFINILLPKKQLETVGQWESSIWRFQRIYKSLVCEQCNKFPDYYYIVCALAGK